MEALTRLLVFIVKILINELRLKEEARSYWVGLLLLKNLLR